MKKLSPKLVMAFIAFGVLCICLLFLFPDGGKSKMPSARQEMNGLNAALSLYRTSFGQYPTGTKAEILRAIMGDNPQHRSLAKVSPRLISPAGELCDTWGTPYEIQFEGANSFTIISAGPDRKFGTSDDVIFDSLKNEFMKP